MKRILLLAAALTLVTTMASADDAANKDKAAHAADSAPHFEATEVKTDGTVSIAGARVDYQAVAGTIVVHAKGWDDSAPKSDKENPTAEASMFYTAYFKRGADAAKRPIMFIYNGGPGSATVWLHMGAFGPKRVVTNDDTHTPAAPYSVVNNDYSLLDASDLVFIDAPGAGFSRIAGKDAKKEFWGVDPDIHAFAEFIQSFLSKYNRWNSPKYLFGESYGTPRSAGLSYVLANDYSIDLNGVVLLSQILNFDLSVDGPETNPGIDTAYQVALPTYAATAWYHNKLPNKPKELLPFLHKAEQFAMGEYGLALAKGNSLDDKTRKDIAQKLHNFTGLPVAYILKANLRISGGEFEKNLQGDKDLTTGRLDTRFSGVTMDPLSKEAAYDPQSAAISSAYISAFNNYVRKDLKYGDGKTYKIYANVFKDWSFKHKQPDMPFAFPGSPNLMPDLAAAMKLNPDMKILLAGGYYDLATPYYEGWYEMHHLTIPPALQKNIEYRYYQSGHMVYAHIPSLKGIHDDVVDFIQRTDNVK